MYLSNLNWYIVLGRAVTELFKDGELDHAEIFREYGRFIGSYPVELDPITSDMLCKEILSISLSSPASDAWSYRDLKALAHCSPWVFGPFCELLNAIETFGRWP